MVFQALDKFVHEFGHFPLAASEEDASRLIDFTKALNDSLSGDQKLDAIDENVLKHFASGSRAVLNPMAAMFGGIVG